MLILQNQTEYMLWKRRKGRAVLRWIDFEKNGSRALYDSKSRTDLKLAELASSRLRTHPYTVCEPSCRLDYDMIMYGESVVPCRKCGFPVSIAFKRGRGIPCIEQTDVCPICGIKNLRFIHVKSKED